MPPKALDDFLEPRGKATQRPQRSHIGDESKGPFSFRAWGVFQPDLVPPPLAVLMKVSEP